MQLGIPIRSVELIALGFLACFEIIMIITIGKISETPNTHSSKESAL